MTIAFIGLGNMGQAIAHNLLKGGHQLTVFNRTKEKADTLMEAGAQWAATPAEAAENADVVFTMLTDDAALREVATGEFGFLDRLPEGAVHVSCSTIAPDTARQLADLHQQRGTIYVACPVFGKPDAAAAAKLWLTISGDGAAKTKVRPLLDQIGQGIYDFGEDPGAANVVKLSGNFMLGCAIEAMAEAFTLAEKNGIDRTAVWTFFTDTLFNSPVYKNYGKMVAEEVYEPVGAAPALIRKDICLVLDEAQKSLVPMPFAQVVHQQLTATVAKGVDNIDWAGFAGEVSENAGVGKR
ncbi:NAD(P)-dependent oxidoreductase [Spirosoma sp. KUDC1026]|uniref:NAD(P)-dependent oxidoreductase n=1 Tax=Spirosoma sp. KUDC1026 TaxID=2745947 RepID=UPI00159BDB1B|nr:NAD(P)-dependent oxidoreductase [Spirosoma sp. KUDC1026]QKZ14971.1 NAD(P)-dependent oxidoreductase [Spirosoma sp. KUDC1026]